MQNTLHEHIMRLELNIQALRDQLTDPYLATTERNQIEAEIRVAELALAYYRKAYELEQTVTSPPAGEAGSNKEAAQRAHNRRSRRPPRTNIRAKDRIVRTVTCISSCVRESNRIEQ